MWSHLWLFRENWMLVHLGHFNRDDTQLGDYVPCGWIELEQDTALSRTIRICRRRDTRVLPKAPLFNILNYALDAFPACSRLISPCLSTYWAREGLLGYGARPIVATCLCITSSMSVRNVLNAETKSSSPTTQVRASLLRSFLFKAKATTQGSS